MTTWERGPAGRIQWRRATFRAALAAIPFLFLAPVALGARTSALVERLESALYDFRLRWSMPGGVDSRIVIVDLDPGGPAPEGLRPWSRAMLARLLDQLFDRFGARVVAFDAPFPQPEETSALALARELEPLAARDPELQAKLEALSGLYAGDERLAEAMTDRNVVLGFAFHPNAAGAEAAGVLPNPAPFVEPPESVAGWSHPRGFVGNLPELQARAPAAGFVDLPLVERDGVVRRAPVLQRYEDRFYESLSLAAARLALGEPPLRLAFAREREGRQRPDRLELGELRIPIDGSGAILIPFRGRGNNFPHVSATRILRGEVSDAALEDAIVLVDAAPAMLSDARYAPTGSRYAGIEAHASVIAGILDQAIPRRPSWAAALEVGMLTALAAFAATVLPRLAPRAALSLIAALIAALVGLNVLAWSRFSVVLPLATPLLGLIGTAALVLIYVYVVESRRRRELLRVFSPYVPPEIMRELEAADAEVSLEGESREMSVLFSDVRGFTTLSEGFSPRELTKLMNELLTPLTEVIQRRRGTIDKYMGDAIMAFWGAPLADPQHASRAVHAALEMVERTKRIRAEFVARGWPAVHIGVGVSSGLMNVGNMGSRFRTAYTVLGDAVNLGSRLEGLTKRYGVEIIVSGATASACPEIAFRELDLVRVKGRSEPVAIYEPLGRLAELPAAHKSRLERFGEMLRLYRSRHFLGAQELLSALAAEREEPLIAIYRQRVAHFLVEPPPGSWDGVFVYQTK